MTEADLAAVREMNAQTRRMVQDAVDRPHRLWIKVGLAATAGAVWMALCIAGTVWAIHGFG